MSGQHRTVSRIVRILEYIAAHPDGASKADIVQSLDAPRSSVQGFLAGLIAEGYVFESGTPPTYRLGHAAHALLLSRGDSILELARPALETLLTDIDETITLGVPVADSVVYLESLTPTHPVCYRAPVRARRPLWPTSCGKIFLAQRLDPVEWVRRCVPDAPSEGVLRTTFADIRTNARAFNVRESMTDVSAVAVRFEAAGHLAGAVSIAGPSGRVNDHLDEYAEHARAVLHSLVES